MVKVASIGVVLTILICLRLRGLFAVKCLSSHSKVEINNSTQTQGSTVIITCTIKSRTPSVCDSNVYWKNHDHNLTINVDSESCSFDKSNIYDESRLKVECVGDSLYRLYIYYLNAYEHSGTWSCGTGAQVFSSVKKLSVCCPPAKPYMYNEAFGDLLGSITPRIPIIRVLLNHYDRIVCNAYKKTGLNWPVLPITYTWSRLSNDGQPFQVFRDEVSKAGSSGLPASEVSKTTLGGRSGRFICQAANRYGSIESDPVQIDILGNYLKPIAVKINLNKNPIDEGEILIITCTAENGNPPPVLLPDGPFKFRSVNYSLDDSYFVYSTVVHKDANNHALWCKAAESVGKSSPAVTIQVNYPPSTVVLSSPSMPLEEYRSFSNLPVSKNVDKVLLRCQTDKTSHPSVIDIIWRKWPPAEYAPRIIGGATVSLYDGTVSSTLEITISENEASAEYRCIVRYRNKDILRSEIVIISPELYTASAPKIQPVVKSIILLSVVAICILSIFSCAINIMAFIKTQEKPDGAIERLFNAFERMLIFCERKRSKRPPRENKRRVQSRTTRRRLGPEDISPPTPIIQRKETNTDTNHIVRTTNVVPV
ncbi:uncharacterized protein LOC141914248 [Tubulanus polymorphus]|uniref:uncharacterized protein LOC141914248 n=1 Tax=Tubulanus polymorphus TaxID=672921 RepID=UPI003DA4A9AC